MGSRTIIVDGFSKTNAMTGWRLGYGVMPLELAGRVGLLLTHSIGLTAQFTQYAGLEAILGPQGQAEAVMAEYQRRRDAVVAGLNTIPGVYCQKPQGAFYVFPNIKATGMTSNELANLILEKAGVALLPGSAFGEYGEGYLRLCCANSIENLERGLERMGSVLKGWNWNSRRDSKYPGKRVPAPSRTHSMRIGGRSSLRFAGVGGAIGFRDRQLPHRT